MEKPLLTSGRSSRNSMRQEDMNDDLSDEDTCISVPSMKELGLHDDSVVFGKQNDKVGSLNEDVITSDQSENNELNGYSASTDIRENINVSQSKEKTANDLYNEKDIDIKYTGQSERKSDAISNERKVENDKKESNHLIVSDVLSGEENSDMDKNGHVDQTESESNVDDKSESNDNDTTSNSDIYSCFGDDEIASHSSVEHWTELQVEKDMIDKLVIHKADGEPVVNLEIIRQIRRGEFRTDSELSEKTPNNGIKSEGMPKNVSKSERKQRKGSKSFNKTILLNKNNTPLSKDGNGNDAQRINRIDNNNSDRDIVTKDNESGLNNKLESVSFDKNESLDETDTSSSEETGSGSESSNSSESDTTSLKSSHTGKSLVKDVRKLDSGYSDNKLASPLSIKSSNSQSKLLTISTQENKASVISSKHRENTLQIGNRMPNERINVKQRQNLVHSSSNRTISEKDKPVSKQNKDKISIIKTTSNSQKKVDQIAKLKQIYRQKTQIKDTVKKPNSSSLPDPNTPKKSQSHFTRQATLHYDKKSDEGKRSVLKSTKTAEKQLIQNKQMSSYSLPNSRVINNTTNNAMLIKRKGPIEKKVETKTNVQIEYIDLNSNININSKISDNSFHQETQRTDNNIGQSSGDDNTNCQRGLHSSKPLEDTSINRFHKQISDMCNKEVLRDNRKPSGQRVDRRFEITINEMFALHGGSSVDTNDSDFAIENTNRASKSKSEEIESTVEHELPDLPSHITQALIADMPIQKLSAGDITRPNSTQNKRTKKDSTNVEMKSIIDFASKTEDSSKNMSLNNEYTLVKGNLETNNVKSRETKNMLKEKNSPSNISSDLVLQEKRKRLQASKTYENIKEYKLSESHVKAPAKKLESSGNDTVENRVAAKALTDAVKPNLNNDVSANEDDSARSIVAGILDECLYQLFTFLGFNGPAKRCTTIDDEGNEVLCCILQAPENKVDPSSFTCEVVDPLEVPPITRRHEFLISHVIKICTYNVGHIAREREMVAKIPIAHFFVEPWQEVVIREVDKSGHWVDTGEDIEIVQIPDMGNVVYGVQIVLKELTYVAVVTRPRITTLTLEHRDKIITSPSDDRVKLRVPGTSDPRTVSLQSIPITEKIIKDFENTRGPEITSYLTAASPMVILSLEGLNPESFSFVVPFTHVNYFEDAIVDQNESTSQETKPEPNKEHDKDSKDTEEILNVPSRVRERMKSDLLHREPTMEEIKHSKHSAKTQLQELETRVHKREKERYLVLLGDGHDRSVQIKLLDDADRVKSFDIETRAQADEVVKFSVYDTYSRLFAIEVHDIVNFQEIQSTVKGLSNYILKHRVRINVFQDKDNLYSIKFTATVDQPYRQKWPRERQHKDTEESNESVRYIEMNEGDAIGLTFRGNIEVTNQVQRVFSFHGYCGINANFDLKIKDPFSQKSLPEFHGTVQVYTLKRPRMRAVSTKRVQNVSADWDLFAEYHFTLPKHLKKTPIVVNRAPISLRFQEPLTVEFVRLMCRELVKDWDTFAFSLGISTARIQAIKQHNRNQISERVLMDVIVCWMKQQPMSRDKVGPILSALRMCRKPHLENELTQRYKALKDCRAKTARDKHIQRAALALSGSRAVCVRWRQLVGYLLHLELNDARICDITSEIEEKYKNDATKCYHALQYWNSVSGSPTIWKIVDALRHCNCHVAANTLRVQEQKRR